MDSLPRIQTVIEKYCAHFRQQFPDVRIILKQHLLEDYALTWLTHYHFGFGLFGEQGMNSIHHKISIITDNHNNIINPVQRLKSTIQEHHLHTLPDIRTQIPPIKKKKL